MENDGYPLLGIDAEFTLNKLVNGLELPIEIFGYQKDGDQNPSYEITESHLQESQSTDIGESRDGNEREGAGLGGDDGKAGDQPGY